MGNTGDDGSASIRTGPDRSPLDGDNSIDALAGTSSTSNGDGESGDLDDYDEQIREIEEKLSELRSQQQRQLDYEQREAEVDDEIGEEAAKMEAAMEAIFGPGRRPSDLLRSATQRDRQEARASGTGDVLEEEGGQRVVEGEIDGPIEAPVSSSPFGGGGGATGNEELQEELPDALMLMDRLDELLALESSASDAGVVFPEEEQDDEAARLRQARRRDDVTDVCVVRSCCYRVAKSFRCGRWC